MAMIVAVVCATLNADPNVNNIIPSVAKCKHAPKSPTITNMRNRIGKYRPMLLSNNKRTYSHMTMVSSLLTPDCRERMVYGSSEYARSLPAVEKMSSRILKPFPESPYITRWNSSERSMKKPLIGSVSFEDIRT